MISYAFLLLLRRENMKKVSIEYASMPEPEQVVDTKIAVLMYNSNFI